MEVGRISIDAMVIVTALLFLATALYTYATLRLTSITSREYKLRIRPLLSFQPLNISSTDWTSMEVEQELTNIGLSYVRIESALLHWWPYMMKDMQRNLKSNVAMPHYLAPGSRLKLRFTISSRMVSPMPQASLNTLSDLLTGHIVYEYRGLDNVVAENVECLP